ncbi:MAG: endonuclease V [Promethearchaeota archaeon]
MVIFQHELLRDDLSLEEAKQLQKKYQSILEKQEDANIIYPSLNEVKKVVGVDISYYKWKDIEFGVSCAVLWNILTKKVEQSTFAKDQMRFSYQAGFLGFRECNLLSRAIEKLPDKPDLVMCDGHGIIHPRRFGEAVQLGIALDIPTIGIAKNPYIGYSEWESIKRKRGNRSPIWNFDPKIKNKLNQELLGYGICLIDNMKPVFISVGYRTTLDLAIEIALRTTFNDKQPEPLYLADQLAKEKVKEILSS